MGRSVGVVLFEVRIFFSQSKSFENKSRLTLCFKADPGPLNTDGDGKRRKKRNRWGDQQENKAAGLMGLPTMIMANFTSEQLEAYTLHLRIEEISQKLRINDVVPADGDRCAFFVLDNQCLHVN